MVKTEMFPAGCFRDDLSWMLKAVPWGCLDPCWVMLFRTNPKSSTKWTKTVGSCTIKQSISHNKKLTGCLKVAWTTAVVLEMKEPGRPDWLPTLQNQSHWRSTSAGIHMINGVMVPGSQKNTLSLVGLVTGLELGINLGPASSPIVSDSSSVKLQQTVQKLFPQLQKTCVIWQHELRLTFPAPKSGPNPNRSSNFLISKEEVKQLFADQRKADHREREREINSCVRSFHLLRRVHTFTGLSKPSLNLPGIQLEVGDDKCNCHPKIFNIQTACIFHEP